MASSDKKQSETNEVVPVEEGTKNESDIDNDQIDSVLKALPENMPPKVKRTIEMSMMRSHSFGGVPTHPLFDKGVHDK